MAKNKLNLIQDSIGKLLVQKEAIDKMQAQITEAKVRYVVARQIVLDDLVSAGTKTLSYKDKYTVSVGQRISVQVDPIQRDATLTWLENNKFDPNEFLSINTAMLEPVAKNALKRDGEIVPGTEIVTSEYLSIRAAKEK